MYTIISQIMNNRIKKITFYILLIIDVFVFLIHLFSQERFIEILLNFLLVSVIIDGLVWLIVGTISKCKYCGEMFAMTKVNSQFLAKTQTTMRVQNRVRDRYGRVIVTVDDNIPAIKREYLDTYKCMYCGKTAHSTTFVKTRD